MVAHLDTGFSRRTPLWSHIIICMLVRQAKPTDAPGIARVFVDTWRSTYRGIIPDDHLANLSYEQREEFHRRLLADPETHTCTYVAQGADGAIAGVAVGGQQQGDGQVLHGELYAIYVLQELQRQGIGRRLVRAVVERLLEKGIRSMLVWVLADNPARAFYETLGGSYVREAPVTIGGKEFLEVAYGWEDLGQLRKELAEGGPA